MSQTQEGIGPRSHGRRLTGSGKDPCLQASSLDLFSLLGTLQGPVMPTSRAGIEGGVSEEMAGPHPQVGSTAHTWKCRQKPVLCAP